MPLFLLECIPRDVVLVKTVCASRNGPNMRPELGMRFASMLDQRVPENEVAVGRSPEDSQEDSQRIREDSHALWRIQVRIQCLFCGFLKDSNETTIPFYDIKR